MADPADFAAGWAAGAASRLAGQPLDTLLVRVQAGGAGPRGGGGAAGAAVGAGARGARRALQAAIRGGPGGLRALWSGVLPVVLVVPLQNALMFAGYGAGERACKRRNQQGGRRGAGDLLPVFVGGTLGGVVQSVVVSPVELLKTARQLAPDGVGLGGTLRSLAPAVRASGPAVLFRGMGATILRDGIPHGVWFAAYAWAKRQAGQRRARARARASVPARGRRGRRSETKGGGDQDEEISAAETLAAGAFAAAVAWAVGYPADPIKTRIQAVAASTGGVPGIRATSRMMLQEARGNFIKAFYRGFGLKIARALPCSAISFLMYERCKAILAEREVFKQADAAATKKA